MAQRTGLLGRIANEDSFGPLMIVRALVLASGFLLSRIPLIAASSAPCTSIFTTSTRAPGPRVSSMDRAGMTTTSSWIGLLNRLFSPQFSAHKWSVSSVSLGHAAALTIRLTIAANPNLVLVCECSPSDLALAGGSLDAFLATLTVAGLVTCPLDRSPMARVRTAADLGDLFDRRYGQCNLLWRVAGVGAGTADASASGAAGPVAR